MRMLLAWFVGALALGWCLPVTTSAAVEGRVLPITMGKDASGKDVVGECYLAWDSAAKGTRPGVLVFPEWWGLNEFAKQKARELAEQGYVALVVDVYGEGRTTADAKEAGELAGRFKTDRKLLRARATAALDTLRKLREVDPKRVAAIGYCFGGTAVLELARSGADVQAVVSFHGDLAAGEKLTPAQVNAEAAGIRARVLVLHGAVDPYVPAKTVQAFMDEMNTAGVDYVFVAYAKAVHSFTNPAAGSDPGRGAAYNAEADRRSWVAMRAFFDEAFK